MWLVEQYAEVFRNTKKPFAFVDMAAWQQNADDLIARCGHKRIRVASKSIRCVELMRRLDQHPQVDGWMCFSAQEAVYLAEQGFDNLLVAYPTLQKESVGAVCDQIKQGKKIILMTDSVEHFKALNDVAAAHAIVLPICIDVDVSVDYPGLHFGVYRSNVVGATVMQKLVDALPHYPALRLSGVMTYDAQIAGVTDADKRKNPLYNALVRWLKQNALAKIKARRAAVMQVIRDAGITLDFFNGGGTGSLEFTESDATVTEATFGSGLYCSTLFDHYRGFHHQPAAGFACEIVRNPKQGVYTCLGGGYIASGGIGVDKQPTLMYPAGKLTSNEGAGEVQTPIEVQQSIDWPNDNFALFRHAKAGELCERFQELILLENGAIIDRVTTYRGDGQCFL